MQYQNFFNEKGRVNSMKVKEEWLSKHQPQLYMEIESYAKLNNLESIRLVEKMWHYFNEVKENIKCKNKECNNTTSFAGLKHGYLEYCSSKCSNSDADVKEQKIKSNLKKYGVKNPYQSEEIKQKIKETNIERHGVENPMHSSKIKSKMINNSIQRAGVPWSLSRGGSSHQTRLQNLEREFKEKYKNLEIVEYSTEKFGECKLVDPNCGHVFNINKWQLYQRKSQDLKMCTVCNPIGSFNETYWQGELRDILNQFNITFIETDRSILGNLELDFYFPEQNLAIELDGLYWHSIEFRNSKYHLNKTERCAETGITLIHVFEDEWIYKKEIVISRILNQLGLSQRREFARKCKVKEISANVAKEFIEKNHIQGQVPASIRLGLYKDEELVSVMTFGNLRKSLGSNAKAGHYEMYRFCNKLNTSVAGGAGKLLNYFIDKYSPKEIISYADRRWSNGGLYKKLGFTQAKTSPPNFWYVKGDVREHRFNYTQKKLIKLVGEELPLETMLLQLNLIRIYDCGSFKFRLTT
jgi:hypothetical protein